MKIIVKSPQKNRLFKFSTQQLWIKAREDLICNSTFLFIYKIQELIWTYLISENAYCHEFLSKKKMVSAF